VRVFLDSNGSIKLTSVVTTKVGNDAKPPRDISRDRGIPTMKVSSGPGVTTEHFGFRDLLGHRRL
jgi:hypothetical protein